MISRSQLLCQKQDVVVNAFRQRQIALAHSIKVWICGIVAFKHRTTHVLARAGQAAASKGVARAGFKAPCGEELGGRGKVSDDVFTGGRSKALRYEERARGIGAHGNDHGFCDQHAVADCGTGPHLIKQVAAQLRKAGIDEQVTPLVGSITPGAAGVIVFNGAAQERSAGRVDLHDGGIGRGNTAAEPVGAERLPAGGAQGKGGAGVSEKEIVIDLLLQTLSKGGQLRVRIAGRWHDGQEGG